MEKVTERIGRETSVQSAELLVQLDLRHLSTTDEVEPFKSLNLRHFWSIRFVVFSLYFSVVMHNLHPTVAFLMPESSFSLMKPTYFHPEAVPFLLAMITKLAAVFEVGANLGNL